MIPTLSTYLYRINRDRARLQDALDKRKALGYVILITLFVTIAVMCWIIAP